MFQQKRRLFPLSLLCLCFLLASCIQPRSKRDAGVKPDGDAATDKGELVDGPKADSEMGACPVSKSVWGGLVLGECAWQ